MAVDHLSEIGGFGVELCALGRDGDSFRCHARLKFEVHVDAILNVDFNRAGNFLLESLLLDGDTVTADLEWTGHIFSVMIGGEGQ